MFAVRLWITTSLSLTSRKSSVHLYALYSPATTLRTFTPHRDQLVSCGRYTSLKRRSTSMRLHGCISQKALICILSVVRAWNITQNFLFLDSPPTFKTATPTSRTQLKLQLMREQIQQQERREAELKQQQLQRRVQSHTPALKVPVSVQSVDVPPQVLQVSDPTLCCSCRCRCRWGARPD
jgi:hypothetical protein